MKVFKNKSPLWALLAMLVLALALTGCSEPADDTQDAPAAKPEGGAGEALPVEQEEEKPPLPLGLYIKTGSGSRERITTMEATYTVGQDIVVLSAFLSEEPAISGAKFSDVWNGLREGIPEAAGCKIGYRLNYETASGETVSQTILEPGDTETNRAYVETYIYDDVHQDGWYSHLLPADVTEETVATTIKLTGGPEVAGVGDITVEAFLYQEDPAAEPVGRCRVEVTKQ